MKKAQNTRHLILQKAFGLIYKKGYQAASIDEIISGIRVTKGAFYYHFKSKEEMGLAVITEILLPSLGGGLAASLSADADPLDVIYAFVEALLLKNEFMTPQSGCPVSNLTQEMASENEDFKLALEELTEQWTKQIMAIIEKGKKAGVIRTEINARQVSLMILSGYWGIRNIGRLQEKADAYLPYLKELKYYLNTLRQA